MHHEDSEVNHVRKRSAKIPLAYEKDARHIVKAIGVFANTRTLSPGDCPAGKA